MEKRLGTCYYPELYPNDMREKFIDEDIRLMKDANFSVVRMAEFTWCLMEPEEGRYEFDWLEHTVNKLGENGIMSILCTPTPCQPVWMAKKYPSTLYVDNLGVQRSYGGRHYHCYNDPVFRNFTVKICRELGKRFGKNPYVIGWQIDNEMGHEHSGRCQCPTCTRLFKKSLEKQFDGNITKLNEAFGSRFWGQEYGSFDEVEPPKTAARLNSQCNVGWMGTSSPALRLAFDRFSSDSIIDYFDLQCRTLREYTDAPITHNSTHFSCNAVNYYDMARKWDVAGVDHYPLSLAKDKKQSGMIYSMNRNYNGKEFWVLENLCRGGFGNHDYQGCPHIFPGTYVSNMAYAFASGADILTTFKWVVFPSGFEQLSYGLLELDRIPGRRYAEFVQAGKDLKVLQGVLESSTVRADVAIVVDYSSLWGNAIKPINREFTYSAYIQRLFSALNRQGINVDIIGSDKRLEGYKAVFVPFAPILPVGYEENIRTYVENGGNLVAMVMPFSRNVWGNGEYKPIPLNATDIFGVRVVEGEPAFDGVTAVEVDVDGMKIKSDVWQETLEVNDAEIIGRFDESYRRGNATMTVRKAGRGCAWYMGTVPATGDEDKFFSRLLDECSVERSPFVMTEGLDVITRSAGDKHYYYVFNSLEIPQKVEYKGELKPVYGNIRIYNGFELGAKDYCVLGD